MGPGLLSRGLLFSWKLEDMEVPVGTYTMVQPGEGPGGGTQTIAPGITPKARLLLASPAESTR